ncbi:choice-of-anchor L domain-containing protein [Flavivirga amylovorans]|uniref:Choice-of-anchor L domain-containing protein n=1 Tax=Flavivirga amylovorans TaxID=870486 RepID=A0ABT8X5Y6_9FLAO|nr:T9SS type B sorting domain-containing protein [Flavivirga amylovorans]MDO5989413.1 choice-of-anchor L domain-containing protein [Flavivirga amylovorans]
MRFIYFILLILICGNSLVFSQQISVDSSIGLQQLIENNLVDGCVDISNINSPVNGNTHGLPSYGYFERASSNFPFENGIILSTGSAASAGNGLITPPLSESSTTWGTDPDLETALGITNTLNATSIEFDIVSISNQIQFNYLFASEDYDGINPCLPISDSFVFLIRESTSTGPYQNIALVPGTSDPINTNNIRPNLLPACSPQNEQYFEGYNIGDTNYIGRSNVLTASTTITPNVQYHVKIIIADQNDGTFDSAVFIEGDSFTILDLGDDIETCASATLLDADIANPLATYAWYLDNNLISGANNPTYNAIVSGTYRVVVTVDLNGTSCPEEDEINVILNSEEPITPISDYELCDDASGDGTEIFDLSTRASDLAANISSIFSNYTFSYHYSEAEARGNINEITAPISNTISPQPIYVRIDDTDSNCFAYTSFNLVVNELPNINTPSDVDVCDTDDSPDGITIIEVSDLTQRDDEITNSQSNLIVSYHRSSADADTGDNPITSPIANTNATEVIYVRVMNSLTGCVSTTTLSVNITISPIINRDTQYIDACDRDMDGTANFNLESVLSDIIGGLGGVTPTFHESLDDANAGVNPIANTTNYQNINLEQQTIYVRIQDDTTGCASIVPLEIHTNLLLTGTDLGDFALCDTNDIEGDTLEFNLTTLESFISNDLPNPVTVTFYETEPDRDSNLNPITKGVPYEATSPRILYLTLNDGNCTEIGDITLLVNPILQFNPANPIPYCDTDDDGIVTIDLHSLDNLVTNDNTNFSVTYFPSFADADANNTTNQLPDFYTNTNPIEDIYARIANNDSGCATTNFFQIQVFSAPPANTPLPIVMCDITDGNPDGIVTINLNDIINNVVTDPTNLEIDFFTTFADADSTTPTNALSSSERTSYDASTGTQIIYVRVENTLTSTNCYNIVEQEIIVNTEPVIPTITPFQICQTGGGNTADFLLADKDAEILDGQTGKAVFYFEDAAFTIPIDEDNIYQNITSPQTIHVRVENITDPTCFDTSSFIIQVSPDPVYNVPTPFLTCDDTSNDGIEVFDLNEKIIEIQGPNPPEVLNITFHLTFLEADNGTNPLPSTYTNTIRNQQTLFVRIESDDSLCHVVETININITAAPNIIPPTTALIRCDEDYDGSTTFDLETSDLEILDQRELNLGILSINYFENFEDINQDDGLDNTNEISNPSSFNSSAKTVYIKIANTLTECFSIAPLELRVNLPPPINTITTIPICDNDTNTFDLSTVDTVIVDDPSLVNISYHNTQNDADNNIAPLSNIFNYTASNHTIFIRVSDITTGCYIAPSFNLQINPNPIANPTPDLITCDDDFDGFFEFDLLSLTENTILGAQNASDFSITYYNSLANAEEGIDSIDNNYLAFDGETIYARIENNNTGCFDTTEFNTRIKPLPVIPIDDIVPLCIDNLPLVISADTGNPDDTYLWSTGATTSEILLDDIGDVGNYSVTVTRAYITGDCAYTHPFSVIESEAATINFTTTVDFADPNSITVDINKSNIGNYVFILDDGEPQTSNIFENVTFGMHTVTVRDLNGCMDITQNVMVFDVPKFITPNSDGYYDTWHIIGIELLPGTIVHIYNRHGKLLKTLPHTSIGWDGTYNGENMPSDDYWFSADVIQNGNTFNVSGHFALKR